MISKRLEKQLHRYFPLGFHLSQKAWDWLGIRDILTATREQSGGRGTTYAMRRLADRVNENRLHRSLAAAPVHAGQMLTVSVIVDVMRYLFEFYCKEEQAGVLGRGITWTRQHRGGTIADRPPDKFVQLFPPVDVLETRKKVQEFLQQEEQGASNRELTAQEMVLLSLAMANPAFKPFRTLFDDTDLKRSAPYEPLVESLDTFFDTQPPFGPLGMTLLHCLRAPIRAYPDDLEGQLAYIRENWATFLPAELLEELTLASDILREEGHDRGLGPGPSRVLRFGKEAFGDLGYPEYERFSRDADWMSNVVLIAKTVYVWLDQLSKEYGRSIRLLSDIPDEELDRLARWGFTGLWLIGLWERSSASQRIKQRMGNPEAASSAYSLYDYIIARDLGGEEAYANLRERAWNRGIRLASDMVPNHMGIYSRWVIEHPDWFIQQDYPPFPCYTFNGPDLSEDDRVALMIEDGYWEHRDAAVVFKRVDKHTGETRYIYHGNDGTSMPWNDTAQLNFLMEEVREGVIQTILHVARKFSIIRFDAAMTLAKKHYQRLWFPLPGEGGAIPSRAEHSMTRAEFEQVFPQEFWREVVDRVAAEVPDTLLLAEAFWLMEGYFVRTLGMHRVYNSAFMNMLKMEENAKYRQTIKNVLEFSPEVLKRFVNFMNNPDERTAVDQFGRGDKYFGVCVMMVTMPGLPMFGHGQIQGFTEKYGMEYRRAYWDEQVDEQLVQHHEQTVFPLMRHRALFSGAENFALYDFNTPEGWLDENVFAYSNRAGTNRALVMYNNAYNTTRGWVHTSTAINEGPADTPRLVCRSVAEALWLCTEDNCYYRFRDYQSGLFYLRHGRRIAEEGLFAVLHAYQYHAFLDWTEIRDTDGSWGRLCQRLDGAGVHNLDEAYRAMQLDPVLIPFRELANADLFRDFAERNEGSAQRLEKALRRFLVASKSFVGSEQSTDSAREKTMADVRTIMAFPEQLATLNIELKAAERVKNLADSEEYMGTRRVPVAWAITRHIGELKSPEDTASAVTITRIRMEEWLLRSGIRDAFERMDGNAVFAKADSTVASALASYGDVLLREIPSSMADTFTMALDDSNLLDYLQAHSYKKSIYINKEQFVRFVNWLVLAATLDELAQDKPDPKRIANACAMAELLEKLAEGSAYQVETLLEKIAMA